MQLVILTGASGSGKTTIANAIRSQRSPSVEVLNFDSIGVPSIDAMMAGWGSCEAWQRSMTLDWMTRIAATRGRRRPMLFEGQMRLAFIREGLVTAGIADARVILVDCDDVTRAYRLAANRRQPELASPTMMSWAACLRREAQQAGYDVLDTSELGISASVERVSRLLGR